MTPNHCTLPAIFSTVSLIVTSIQCFFIVTFTVGAEFNEGVSAHWQSAAEARHQVNIIYS